MAGTNVKYILYFPSYCKQEPDIVVYLFVECVNVKEFWQSLQIWLLKYNIRNILDKKVILFSYQGKCKLKNYLMVVEKHYIYQNKFSTNKLKINTFISMVKVQFQCQRFIAKINNKYLKS